MRTYNQMLAELNQPPIPGFDELNIAEFIVETHECDMYVCEAHLDEAKRRAGSELSDVIPLTVSDAADSICCVCQGNKYAKDRTK